MGYRVGQQCFNNLEQAHDYLLSQLSPTVTQDGRIIRPVKNGKNWYLENQQINLSFPQCDIAEQIQLGALTAAPIIGLFVLIFGIRMIRKLIESMTSIGNGDD
ncbi:hypothetical protein [Neisseria mucosa]|uniref:hypothetical protein n=1 Tax=Neisseria mucosa TaxID=488 RepID=UPI0027DF8B14|nr:hypothetical protein [Neisseria mucosa]